MRIGKKGEVRDKPLPSFYVKITTLSPKTPIIGFSNGVIIY